VFNWMPTHNVVSWNPMILGHVKCGEGQRGVELFQQMQHEGGPDHFTFVVVLSACASAKTALEEGRCIHQQISSYHSGVKSICG
jgi:pentatricopeptide repeat protein